MNLNRITILTSEFPPQPGGIGNHAYNLAKGFSQHNYKVTVLCDKRSKTGVEERRFDAALGFKVVRIQRKKIIFFTYISRIQQGFLLAGSSDVILASGKFSLWMGGIISLFLSKKYIAVIHGSELVRPKRLLRRLTNFSLRRFDSVIAVSNYTKSLVTNVQLKKLIVIPNGFEINNLSISGKRDLTALSLITVGNVTQRKGQHNVIKALPTLLAVYPNLKYHIVGIPTEAQKLQRLALNLKVEKALIFHGQVTESEKVSLLQQANVFVMLSEATQAGDVEGFGIAVLEANALGIPVIGARGSGVEDAIKHNYSGKLIEKDNHAEFLQALKNMLIEYESYSEGALKWSENFKWDAVMPQYIKTLFK